MIQFLMGFLVLLSIGLAVVGLAAPPNYIAGVMILALLPTLWALMLEVRLYLRR